MIWLGLVVFGVGMSAILIMRRERELHHLYYGAAIFALALWHAKTWLLILGMGLMLDDTIQHVTEVVWGDARYNDDFTPIHKLGAYLMDWKKQGMWLPLAIALAMAAAAIFAALHFGV